MVSTGALVGAVFAEGGPAGCELGLDERLLGAKVVCGAVAWFIGATATDMGGFSLLYFFSANIGKFRGKKLRRSARTGVAAAEC
jgi:hypothetical protein